MTDKIILVTDPDDSTIDCFRLLLVELSILQTELISKALTTLDQSVNITAYVWNFSDSVEWLVDKKHKSNMIIFNADSNNHIITGYMAAQPNSYYFGTLKNLYLVNTNSIFTLDQCNELIDTYISLYKKHFR